MAQPQTPQHIFVSMRRTDTSQPWGFRMKGGAQMGMPLFVEQVAPNGRAHKAGMAPGDLIVVICGTNVAKFSHDQAKSEILRAGNELDFTLQRGTPSGRSPLEALAHIQSGGRASPAQQQQMQQDARVQVVEEPTCRLGGPVYKDVQPKTYQILKGQLPDEEPTAPGKGPASIFDRKRQERSQYLKASGSTIQKAFGEG